MVRIPSLDALRIFVVAARHVSFTEAADALHLTQSAISHRIRGLEDALGVPLFNRLTRGLELTARGRALARRIELAIGEIDRSVVELTQRDTSGPLKVTMSPAVASHWLIPRLPSMRSRYPDLDVQVIADHQPLNLRTKGIDLAIRFCRTPQSDYAITRLMGDRVIPVCAPAFLERHGPVETIDALLSLPLLDDWSSRAGDSGSDWRAWLDHHDRPDADCRTGQKFSDAGMLIDAARLGLGVALARVSLVADRLASGALVCPLRLVAPTAFSYYLLCLPEAVDRPKIALLRSILISEAAMTEASILAVDRPFLLPSNADCALSAAASRGMRRPLFDRPRRQRAVRTFHDRSHTCLGFREFRFAMSPQRGAALIGVDRVFKLLLAALQAADDLLQLCQRVFKRQCSDIGVFVGHVAP